jgi:hypothetical protein
MKIENFCFFTEFSVGVLISLIFFSGCTSMMISPFQFQSTQLKPSVPQCGYPPVHVPENQVTLFSAEKNVVDLISFDLELAAPKKILAPVDMNQTTITISTGNVTKTLTYQDPTISHFWKKLLPPADELLDYDETIHIAMNIDKMSPAFNFVGRDQNFSITIQPKYGRGSILRGKIPDELNSGSKNLANITLDLC